MHAAELIKKYLNVSMVKKAAAAYNLVRYYTRHYQLDRLCAEAGRPKHPVAGVEPRFRQLKSSYLGGAFNMPARLTIAINHYRFMLKHMRSDFLYKARFNGVALWQKSYPDSDNVAYDIKLRIPYFYNFDGELSLTMGSNGADICIVSFVIAPGHVADAADEHIALVTGIQGVSGKIEEVRKATELCNNVSPANMLMAAVEAFALSVGISTMVGVGRLRTKQSVRAQFAFNYDAFWMPVIGAEEPAPFYHVPVPFKDKPIEAIQAKHRTRALKRREQRHIIRTDIIQSTQAVIAADCVRDQRAVIVTPAVPSSNISMTSMGGDLTPV